LMSVIKSSDICKDIYPLWAYLMAS